MTDLRIVTNGEVFRIQKADGTFVQEYVSLFESRKGSYQAWQTRSYIKALKRFGQLVKGRVSARNDSKWLPVDSTVKELQDDINLNEDFMAFMTGELSRWPCCHEKGKHVGTPPMMWPELIACIVKKAVLDDRLAAERSESVKARIREAAIREREGKNT